MRSALLTKGLGANLLMGLVLSLGHSTTGLSRGGGARALELCLWLLAGGILPRHLLQV